jgi:hypothetical protein
MNQEKMLWAVWLGLIMFFLYMDVAIAATPMDGMFTNFLGSLPLWGQVFVGVGGLGLCVLLLMAINNPMLLIGFVIGSVVLVLVAAAANGSLWLWVSSLSS